MSYFLSLEHIRGNTFSYKINNFFIDGSKIKNYNICDKNVNNYSGSYNNSIHDDDGDCCTRHRGGLKK